MGCKGWPYRVQEPVISETNKPTRAESSALRALELEVAELSQGMTQHHSPSLDPARQAGPEAIQPLHLDCPSSPSDIDHHLSVEGYDLLLSQASPAESD